MAQNSKWELLLAQWNAEMRSIWGEREDKCKALGLPPIDSLQVVGPNTDSVAQLQSVPGALSDPEVIGFYLASDGWPLWLGSSWIALAPASRVALLRDKYQDALEIAMSTAPDRRRGHPAALSIGKAEIFHSIVLSEPGAREIVLSLPSGETCLYGFDSMRVYRNLFEFMVDQKARTLRWVLDVTQE